MRYTIKKNKHFSNFPIKICPHFNVTEVEYEIKFSQNCIYSLGEDNLDNYDINKLIGFNFGFMPHQNSIRIGWRSSIENKNESKNKIKLFAYYYNYGIRYGINEDLIFLADVEPENVYRAKIIMDRKKNILCMKIYQLNNPTVIGREFKYSFENVPRWGFKLFPFFGGTSKAPHKMNINIKRIK